MESQKRPREDEEFDFLNFGFPEDANNVLPTLNVSAPNFSNHTAFTIVVGGQSFCLSWESLKSDGPSNFFVEFFSKKRDTRTLHVDKDPELFALIVKHLRGYYVYPENDVEYLNLLRDANFYGLNRLKTTLQEYLFVNVGGRSFRLPWSLFLKDNQHNMFNGPLRHTITSQQNKGYTSPIYIDRDPDTFQDIIYLLRGYTIDIKSKVHRENLLKDSQYYAFRQLTDKLLTAKKTATFNDGPNMEIMLLLNDVRVMNIQSPKSTNMRVEDMDSWQHSQLRYKRDGFVHKLLVQVNDLCMDWEHRETENKMPFEMGNKERMTYIAQNMKVSMNTNIYIDENCAVTIDNEDTKTYKELFKEHMDKLFVERAICEIHLIDNMVTLYALKIEAISSKFKLNSNRQFLPSA